MYLKITYLCILSFDVPFSLLQNKGIVLDALIYKTILIPTSTLNFVDLLQVGLKLLPPMISFNEPHKSER